MAEFTIATHGDDFEKKFWALFAADEFPSYETFWQRRVVPLTRREVELDITAKSAEELREAGYTDEDFTISQLHYTCLLHLGRVHELRAEAAWNLDRLIEAFSRLVGALDVADELLERSRKPGRDPWSEQQGRDARAAWRSRDPTTKPIRDYRNRLVHGRVIPNVTFFYGAGAFLPTHPRIDTVDKYVDWRVLHGADGNAVLADFATAGTIIDEAWSQVLGYLEDRWQRHLLD